MTTNPPPHDLALSSRVHINASTLAAARVYEASVKRRTAALFAWDVKITPSGEVKVIEGNGSNFSWKGFRKADPEDSIEEHLIEYLLSFGPPVAIPVSVNDPSIAKDLATLSGGRIKAARIEEVPRTEADFTAFAKNLCLEARATEIPDDYGIFLPMNAPSHFGNAPTDASQFERVIFDKSACRMLFDPSRYLVLNPFDVNIILRDKTTTRNLFYGELSEYVADGIELKRDWDVQQESEYASFLDRLQTDRVVIKPTDESMGRGIRIKKKEGLYTPTKRPCDIFTLTDSQGKVVDSRRQKVLIEEFVESKLLYSYVTGKQHDGCMRYVAAVETFPNGSVKVTHFGGYWRLCPEPMDSNASLERKLKANLADGAIPQRATDDDLETVANAVDRFAPLFYRRALSQQNLAEIAAVREIYISDTSNVVSGRQWLSERTRSSTIKTKRGGKLDYYSLDELSELPLSNLQKIREAESLPAVQDAYALHEVLMDRKARMQYNGAIVYLNPALQDPEHIGKLRYQEAYAMATLIHLSGRARLVSAELRKKLQEYRKVLSDVSTTTTAQILQLPDQKLRDYNVVLGRVKLEAVNSRAHLLQRTLDLKVMLADNTLVRGEHMAPANIERLNQLQLYELALQYDLPRVKIDETNQDLDRWKLITVLNPIVAEKPKLSVFVDAYNSGVHLRECLETIMAQEVAGGFEVCLIVDGTDVTTCSIVKEMQRKYNGEEGRKIRARHTFTEKGHSVAYERAMEMTRGDYIVSMHGSGRLYTDKGVVNTRLLAKLVESMESEGHSVLYPRQTIIDTVGKYVDCQYFNVQESNGILKPFVMFHRDVYTKLQERKLAELPPSGELPPDADLGLRLGQICDDLGLTVYHLKEFCYERRLNDGETKDALFRRIKREVIEAKARFGPHNVEY